MESSITRKLTAVFFAAMFVMFVTLATAPGAKAADTTKPTGAISISGGDATKDVNVTVTLAPTDTGSGIASYCLSNTQIRTCSAWTAFNAEATDVPWTLNGAKDGVKTVYALFKDGSSNISSLIRDTIKLDRTPPTGSIKINKGAATTSSTEVTLNLTASDRNGSGVAKMIYSIDGGDWITEAFATSKKITLATGNGIRIVQVRFIDKADNESGPYSASIILDSAAPTITSLMINDGATYTNSAAVTLTPTVEGDVSNVCYSNSNDKSSCKWENFSATKKYTLPKGDGEKTVYAWVKDKLGNTSSESASDIITLDTTKPAGSIAISNSDTTNTSQVSITLSPSDAGENSSGMASYCLSNTPVSTCNTWTSFSPEPEMVQAASTSIAWVLDGATDGLKTVYALFKDNAGNISASIKDTIKLDRTPPTGSVKINNGAASTSNTAVTLTLTANDGSGSGIDKITYSINGSAGTTVDFKPTIENVSLAEGGDGPKTIQVTFTDKAGNTSGPYSASIILDTAAPTGIVLTINNSELYTNSAVVTLNLAASDAGSGVDKVCYANSDDKSTCTWENFNVTKKYTLPLPKVDGLKTVYVWVKDKLGYISETTPESIASITLDTTPPELAITTDSFRTRLTSGAITGTKEANSTVSVKLNGTQIDSSSITQTPEGTSWSAVLGTFTKGSNKISVTATDLASNETVKPLVVTYDPDTFVSADLTGDWYFVSSGFNTSTDKSWTGYGDVTIEANSSFAGSYADGTLNSTIKGKLVIDKNGNITGNATIGASSQIKITNGKMDYNWSMFTILVGNEMLTAVKKGGDFQQTDLAGGWHMYSVYSQQYVYNPLMTSAVGWGTMTCEDDGDLSSGTFNNVSPAVPITVVGSITGESSLNTAGVVSGNLSIKGAVLTTVATFSGQMSPQKNIALIRSTGSGITAGTYNKLIILKDGGDFNLSDLKGRWYLEGIYGDTQHGEVYHGYIDVTESGAVSGGTINGEALLHNNIQLAIDTVSGEITTTNGDLETDDGAYPITAAKLDSTKNVITLVSGLKVFVGYVER
jgi:hypothetical protein